MLMPEEIKEVYKQIDQKAFKKKHKKIDEIHQYILAMTNLYGAYHLKLVLDTYNEQNGDNLSFEELLEIVFRLNNRRQYFYYHSGIIINEYYASPDMEDELQDMIKDRKDKPFYIPEKSELLKYADDLYPYETPETAALTDYIEKKFKLNEVKAENLVDEIRYLCSIDEPPSKIMEVVNENDVIFDSVDQVNEFFQLVMNVNNTTRRWSNGGHTPDELFEKHEKPHLRPIPKVPFVVNPNQARSEKVGRNDPCPCGSGKKYKKCCGS